jgi:nucleoside-diphosphate-sugar epimerase
MPFDTLVTGATGFVGSEIAETLEEAGQKVIRSGRGFTSSIEAGFMQLDLRSTNFDSEKLNGIQTIIHCAAAVHNSEVDESSIFSVNCKGTEVLVDAAIKAGVQHFIFLSSVAVFGLSHNADSIADDYALNPQSPYAKSKLKAEEIILEKCRLGGMKYTILRLPLVFGAGAPGNFGKIVNLSLSGIPLPFGDVHNKRTIVFSKNLADFIVQRCLAGFHDNQVLLFSDGIVLSTAAIIEGIRKSVFKPVRNIRVSVDILRLLLVVLGARKISNQLLSDLVFEPSIEIYSSGWKPKYSATKALELSAKTD